MTGIVLWQTMNFQLNRNIFGFRC